jgi:hypothetical protein
MDEPVNVAASLHTRIRAALDRVTVDHLVTEAHAEQLARELAEALAVPPDPTIAAVWRAWHDPGPSRFIHERRQAHVAMQMPELARALTALTRPEGA